MPLDPEVAAEVRAWAAAEPDPAAAVALLGRLDAAAAEAAVAAELTDAFTGALAFGTAGLRGAMGAGPNRMNRLVVRRAAAGLGAYLTDRARRRGTDGGTDGAADGGPERPSVVVGYDARHHSATFARDTAAVLTGAGLRVLLLPRPLPTPVLAFAVRFLRTDAGVMVTASHNPAADNGYKVYLGGEDGGAQIVPPADARIAACLAAVGSVADVAALPLGQGWEVLDSSVVGAYLAGVHGVVGPAPSDGRRSRLRVAATTLHGVGAPVLTDALADAGFGDVTLVPEQANPDPDFPTVQFPNPEEPGALDLALDLARRRDADLLLALDPDADRCAVAVPGPAGWRVLSGDELGAVLGDHLARRAGREGSGRRTLAASIVSSELLAKIAAAHGLPFAPTLTGFKWISRAPDLLFGYEEAIGYCVAPDLVRDKDGISTALLVAALAADLAATGRTVLDVLDDLAAAHGVHATGQVSVRVSDLSLIPAAMARLRADPPGQLAGQPVTSVEDLARGSAAATGVPPTEGLRWRTEAVRVVVRPSGTEPKLKCYLEVRVPATADVPHARAVAATALRAVTDDVRRVLAEAGLG